MQVEINIYPNFIAGVVHGAFSMTDAQAGLNLIAEACVAHGRTKVLLDGRALQGGFGIADRYALGEFLAAALPQGTRIATLVDAPLHQESMVFQNTANNRGALVFSTDNAEDAARFLDVDIRQIG